MSVAMLDQVRAAEEKADAIRREAAEQAREIIKGVEEAILEEQRQNNTKLRARYQEKMKENRLAVEAALRARDGEKQRALEALRLQAGQRQQAAARLIVERVMQHGDC